ncbi:MAG: hypothetical protein M1820_002291 [Bogoriella megaspora]|nr:MAG: hypothetical protein M1820_002291 [Bogoriella megaspora]
MPTIRKPETWYQSLSIDVFLPSQDELGVAAFFAWILPLLVLARGALSSDPILVASTGIAVATTLLWVLSLLNQRVAYGPARHVNLSEEVVVITGGASGLGLLLAETLGMKGAAVAVLDVKQMQDEVYGVEFYSCNVSDKDDVERAAQRIRDELGDPTILINNAGVVNGKRLLDLNKTDIERNFQCNLVAHFYTIQAFLPGMLRSKTGGTIVTIASVLGYLGAARLSDYTASKAGLLAMHASLRAELEQMNDDSARNIRTILVTPGQLGTDMFKGVESPSSFVGPVVQPLDLVKKLIDMIHHGKSGELSMPAYARWIKWYYVFPAGLQRVFRWASGVDRAMDGFRKDG